MAEGENKEAMKGKGPSGIANSTPIPGHLDPGEGMA